jgi:hypothetical protein
MGSVGGFLKGLFGASRANTPTRADGGIYVRVKCDACGEVVQARVSPTSELSLDDDGKTYFVRKVLVGRQCYRPIEVLLRYADLRGTEVSREIHGGTSVN